MKTIFSIPPSRLGGLDMLIPIFIEIKKKKPKTKIVVIFFSSQPYNDMQDSKFLFDEYIGIVDSTIHIDYENRKTDIISTARFYLSLIPIVFKMLISPKFILLHSRGLDSLLMKTLYLITKIMRGRIFEHMKNMHVNFGRTSNKKIDIRNSDGFLCFSHHDSLFFKKNKELKFIPIGYPRLYNSWLNRVQAVSGRYFKEECERLQLKKEHVIVSLFLGSTVEGIFDKLELEEWIKNVIFTLKCILPNVQILIKPHPMQYLDHLQAFLHDLDERCLYITYLHPSLLATNVSLVIARHTSIIIDALITGTPTILFQNFSSQWLKTHPEGSSYLKLGVSWARDVKELNKYILDAMSPNYKSPDIIKKLEHKENISMLLQ
jgi:hypothetical protein